MGPRSKWKPDPSPSLSRARRILAVRSACAPVLLLAFGLATTAAAGDAGPRDPLSGATEPADARRQAADGSSPLASADGSDALPEDEVFEFGEEAAPPRYRYFLPILGDRAAERGYEFPLPIGAVVVAAVQEEEIEVAGISFAIARGAPVDGAFLRFGKIRTTSYTGLARVDLWLLPFLNAYGMVGETYASTKVELRQPLSLDIEIGDEGPTYGFGGMAAVGNELGFLAVDVSLTWTKLAFLTRPQRTVYAVARLGHDFRLADRPRLRLAVWVGASYEHFASNAIGRLRISDVLPGGELPLSPDIADYISRLTPDQLATFQSLIMDLLPSLLQGGLTDAPVDFDVKIRPVEAWNMIGGLRLEITPYVQLVFEGGFLGERTSGIASIGLRIGI